MYIKELYIETFGALSDRKIEFSRGLNIIEGSNESGKSTVCMFIKFMLYGLSGRGSDGEMSEKAKYVSWETGRAAGKMVISTGKGEYLIERNLLSSTDSQGQIQYKEQLEVTNTVSGERAFKGQVPGEAILGFPEEMFVNTVFVRQITGSRIDGEGMTEAIENLLLTGDENLSVKRAVDRLEKARKSLMHKRGTGGKLQLAMQEEARLEARLEEAKQGNAGIISYENERAKLDALIAKRTAEKEENALLCDASEKLERAKRLSAARELSVTIDELSAEYSQLEKYGNLSEGVGRIKSRAVRLENTENRLKALRRSVPILPDPSDRMSEAEIAEAEREKEECLAKNKRCGLFTVLFAVFYAVALIFDVLCFALPKIPGLGFADNSVFTLILASLGGAFLLAALVFTFVRMALGSSIKKILKKWESENVASLEGRIDTAIMKARIFARTEAEITAKEAEIAEAEVERDSVLFALREAARVFVSDEIADTDILVSRSLEKAAEVAKRREELLSQLGMAKGEINTYSDVLSDDMGERVDREAMEVLETDVGQRAKSFGKRDVELAKEKKRFAENALPHLLEQKREVELSLTHLRATTQDSAAIAALLDGNRREIDTMKKNLLGIESAREAIIVAGERLRASLMPRVISEAGNMLSDFTDGRYASVSVDREFNAVLMLDGKRRELSYMSQGTGDIVYIALRSALAKVLFANDMPPIVYDESFARIDEERLSGIMALLDSSARRGAQSLVFTCRRLEGDIAKKYDKASVTEL